MENAKY
jgi:hypothetical protein